MENASCVTLNMTSVEGSIQKWYWVWVFFSIGYFFLQGECWAPWSVFCAVWTCLLRNSISCSFAASQKSKPMKDLGHDWHSTLRTRAGLFHCPRGGYYKIWPSQMDDWTWTLTLKSKQMQTLTTHLLTIRGGLAERLNFLVFAFVSITTELFCKCNSFGTIVCNF